MPTPKEREHPSGASFVGVLLVIVILGAIATTTVVGLHSINGSDASNGRVLANATGAGALANRLRGSAKPGVVAVRPVVACQPTADAARTASSIYFADHGGSYPRKWADLTAAEPQIYKLPTSVTIGATNPTELDGPGWRMFMSGGGSVPSSFACR
jgi:hypothetical protein